MNESVVTLTTMDGPMDLHAFVPQVAKNGPTRRLLPAVMVLQEAFGVNEHIKRVCRRLAAEGYAAFAPELFHRAGPGLTFGYDEFPKIKLIMGALSNDQIAEDLRVTFRHIAGRPEIDPNRVASWGFCLGGWASVEASIVTPLRAAISFYGGGLVRTRPGIGFTPLVSELRTVRCPLLLVYGGQDKSIPPEDITAMRAGLTEAGKPFEIEIYPEAGHGFFCEERTAYHKASAEAAWPRSAAWLKAQLA